MAATAYGFVAVGGQPGAERAWTSVDGLAWAPMTNGAWTGAEEVDAVVGRGSLVVVAGASDGRAGIWLGRSPGEAR